MDNEKAADYLRTEAGQNDLASEWAVVRPGGLVDKGELSEYKIHPSPTRNAIFDAGRPAELTWVTSWLISLQTMKYGLNGKVKCP